MRASSKRASVASLRPPPSEDTAAGRAEIRPLRTRSRVPSRRRAAFYAAIPVNSICHPFDRAPQGAETGRAHQQPELSGAAVEDRFGEHRHQHGIRHAGERDDAQQNQQRFHRCGSRHEREPRHRIAPCRTGHGGPGLRRHLHQQQTGDHRDVAQAIQQKAPALADRRDEETSDRGTDHARAVDHRGIQRDRIHQVVAPDHFHEERLPRRDVECIDHAEAAGQHQHVPHADRARERERGEDQRQHHRRALRRDDDAVATRAIRHRASDRRKEENRREADERRDAEQRGRASQPEDEPRFGHRLHPRAGERNQLAAEEQAIVAMTESAEEGGRH